MVDNKRARQLCLASQENWLQSWRLVKWALQTVKLKSFAENVSQLFLYQMLQETKWENLFHLNQQIIAKSLPGLIHTYSKSIWLTGFPKCWLSGLQLFSYKCWEQGVRCCTEIVSWQLPVELGKLPAACSLSHSLTPVTSLQMCKWHLRGLCAELVICPHPVYPPLVCRNMLGVRNVSLAQSQGPNRQRNNVYPQGLSDKQ